MKTALIVVGVLAILAVIAFFFLGQKSQSGSALGLVNGKLADCPSSPNCASSERGTPDEKRVDALPSDAWAKLPAAVEAMGGIVTVAEPTYLAAQFTSKTFKFVDDLEFRLDDDAVQVRSASRVGYSDRGVNKARIEALRVAL
ncbi:MAG: DUF1499 domain-containing protein [Pseudomonadota bacterium]